MAFTHLHLHTEYSLLDGACRINKLIPRLKEMGMTSCAITDHGVMYGCIDFYQAMHDAGLKPIIGCEAYICRDRTDKSGGARENSHLILLCENNTGYKNLMFLISEGFLNGFYYRPRIDYKLLREHSEGLICLSACISGDLPKLLLDEQYDEARKYIAEMQDIFGKDNFYVEIMDHGIHDEKLVVPRLISIAKEMGAPLVATNDCHYLEEKDADAQEILMCIQTGKTLDDTKRMRMETSQLYVKSEAEMRSLFPYCPEAIDMTQKIADRCNVTIEFGVTKLPRYPVLNGETSWHMLCRLCGDGMKKFYPDATENDEPYQRLNYELNTIKTMGYVDYFLIVWDFIHYAKSQGIMVGPGRGSGAGSIVAYTLEITMLDPLKYQLLFERFLNPERVSMPDIDVDFCYERRQEVIDYVYQKYGADHVSQIITFGTMAAKGVIRDVGRVMGMTYQDVDVVAKAVPTELGITLEKALQLSPQLRQMYEDNPQVQKLIDTAMTLEGMPRNASTHAAGVLITGEKLTEYVPLQRNGEIITTQYPKDTIEHLGLLKMDFLGLRTLTVIRDALDIIRSDGVDMKPEDIPMDDPETYKMISDGETDGVFQLEGSGMTSFLTEMKPECFEDIIAAISLYRPGPMESIPKYIAGKKDPSKVVYQTEKLRPILDVTYGCMVYQEQVMQIVRDLAGYSYGRSDLVRRAMAKKKHKVMEEEREIFVNGQTDENGNIVIPGCIRNGVSEKVANNIYDQMISFASYAFNKSHAAAYSVVAMQTAWLKRYYPVPFMAAMINSVYGNTPKVAAYVQYCRSRDIPIIPPDINKSTWKFTESKTTDGKVGILFGLGAVKAVGEGAIDEIVNVREKSPFRDIFDFCRRINVSECTKAAVKSLISVGAFDSLGATRPQMLAVYEQLMDSNSSQKKGNMTGQVSLFDMTFGEENADNLTQNPELPDIPDFSVKARLALEKECSGVYITGHPLDDFRSILEKFHFTTAFFTGDDDESAEKIAAMDGRHVDMAGIIVALRGKATKQGAYMGFATLEDLTGQIECLIFPKIYERYQGIFGEDDVVVFSGRISIREDEAPKLLVETIESIEDWQNENPEHKKTVSRNMEQPGSKVMTPAQEAQNAPRKLYLRISRAQLDAAAKCSGCFPGNVPVYVHIPDERITLIAARESWCDGSSQVVANLTELFGCENVKLVEK